MKEMELIELLKALRQGKSNLTPNQAAVKNVQELEKDTVAALHWHVKEELDHQTSVDANRPTDPG